MKNKILSITQLGQPVLRQRAQTVPKAAFVPLQGFIDAMIATMKKADGVGIAANQVGVGTRVFIVAPSPNSRYPNAPDRPPVAMINPRLVAHSKETIEDWEGCLSIPGIRGIVPRYKWVDIAYTTRDGKSFPAEIRIQFVEFSGQRHFFVFGYDISARQAAQKAEQDKSSTAADTATRAKL